MFYNPGRIAPTVQPPNLPESQVKTCRRCDQWKPPRAHHCRTCSNCILRMDHHCHWVNNCIGPYNQKHFILFLFYTGVGAGILAIVTILPGFLFFWTCTQRELGIAMVNWHRTLLGAFGALQGVFFAHFCYEFLSDQVESMQDNQTTIESLKDVFGEPIGFDECAKLIFGKEISVLWLTPLVDPDNDIHLIEYLYSHRERRMRNFLEYDESYKKNYLKKQEAFMKPSIANMIVVVLFGAFFVYRFFIFQSGPQVTIE
eukprot:CAMPEP_0114977178 /NCGR_PEP_ID=MMETSP0216-20121206/3087_1 /TAXON_ID=223996 /ORGANISM="Protocruzia adherens, Strain Boccale" /LENGTH=256 /DNA_ID=CAMNT_0002338195 /DNA_START=270 /DNA_END=1040 /DNA_ORIENTATION=-